MITEEKTNVLKLILLCLFPDFCRKHCASCQFWRKL